MKIVVTLGYYLNDDKSMRPTLKKRLDLTKMCYEKYHPDKIIVSGGIANVKANISEAEVMKEYLVNCGIDEDKIITENLSHTTWENAVNSCQIANSLGVDELIICSTMEHFIHQPYNTVDFFNTNLARKDCIIQIFTASI